MNNNEDIVGKTLTYKQITEVLNLPYVKGNQKNAQMKQLESIYQMNKIGTKYEIISKYDVVLPIIDERVKTLPYIEAMLLNYFSRTKNKEDYYLSNIDIAYLCGCINNNYRKLLKTEHKYDLYISDLYLFTYEFTWYSNNTYVKLLKPAIDTALKSMEMRKEISVTKAFKLYDEQRNCFVYTDINDELGKEINEIQGDVMKSLNIYSYKTFFTQRAREEDLLIKYYGLVNAEIVKRSKNNETWRKNKWNFNNAFSCKHIVPYTNKINWDLQSFYGDRKKLEKILYDKLIESKVIEEISIRGFKDCFTILNTQEGDEIYPICKDIETRQLEEIEEALR